MTIDDVLNYYGTSYNMEQCTGMRSTNVPNWKARGYIPIASQMRLERLSEGELTADLSHCNKEEFDVEHQ